MLLEFLNLFIQPFSFLKEKRKMTGEKEKRMAVAVGNRLSLLISRLFFFLEPQGVLSFHKRKKGAAIATSSIFFILLTERQVLFFL